MPSDPLVSTKSANILHAVSIFISIVILALAIQDCGMLSLCLNPFFAILTISYNITLFVRMYNRPEDAPILSIWYTISAYLLSLGWLGAYICMAFVLSSREKETTFFHTHIMIPQEMRDSQRVQMLLDPVEFALIGNIAVKRTIERLQLCKSKQMHFFD